MNVRSQVFAIPGGAQAKVEDMSRALLSHVSQIPGKSFFQQVTSGGSGQPLADFGKKLAVSITSSGVLWGGVYAGIRRIPSSRFF